VSRLDATFTRLRARGERALVAYFTAGDPSLEANNAKAHPYVITALAAFSSNLEARTVGFEPLDIS